MDLGKITYVLIISLIASFLIRATGTLFPSIFQNVYVAKAAILTNTCFMIVHTLFYIGFSKYYAVGREQILQAGSLLAVIGSLLVVFLYFKNFCRVFDIDVIPLSLQNHYFDAAIPMVSSLFHLFFFCIFKSVQSHKEYRMLNRPISSGIIGGGIFLTLHSIVLINLLTVQKFNWLEHMHRSVAVGTVPLIVIAVLLILHFYVKFYQFLHLHGNKVANGYSK